MNRTTTSRLVALAAAASLSLTGTAFAKHGADDPAGHVRHGADDAAGHHHKHHKHHRHHHHHRNGQHA
jgi:hypothetical protein